jgi:hypothetical protein
MRLMTGDPANVAAQLRSRITLRESALIRPSGTFSHRG